MKVTVKVTVFGTNENMVVIFLSQFPIMSSVSLTDTFTSHLQKYPHTPSSTVRTIPLSNEDTSWGLIKIRHQTTTRLGLRTDVEQIGGGRELTQMK